MNKFDNLKTGKKLIVSFASIVGFLLLLGVLSVVGMTWVSDRTEIIYKINLLPIKLLGDLQERTQRMSAYVSWHILAYDSATVAKQVEGIAKGDEEIDELVKAYNPVIVSESERKYVEQFITGLSEYKEVRTKVLELSTNFSKDAASELQKTQLAEKLEKIHDAIKGLIRENEQQAKDSFETSQTLSRSFTLAVIVFCILASAVGIFGSMRVTRFIVGGLSDVLQATQELQKGNLTHRSSLNTTEEIGQLAQAFNQMGEALEQSMVKQQEAIEEMNARVEIMNTTSIVSEANLKGDILTANDKYVEVSKYSREELLGKPHSITRHADMPKEVFKQMWHTIGQGKIFRGVIKNRAKDGTPYYVDAVIKPIMGPDGKPRKYLGVRYDITEYEIARHNMKGIIDAIDKSYATIEFDLKGRIQTANDFFLKTMGYRLDELTGKHHSIFVEPVYNGTPEYRVFWEKLERGEHDANQYKYLAKSGETIWFQAGYTPVMDEVGRPFKVIMLATNITEQKQALVEVEQLIKAAAVGQLSQRMETDLFTGSSRELADGVNRLLESVTQPLHEAQGVLTALAINDLSPVSSAHTGGRLSICDALRYSLAMLPVRRSPKFHRSSQHQESIPTNR